MNTATEHNRQFDTPDILKSILNSMDAYLYVSDVNTDEILFINDRMRDHFGLDDNAVGSICWKVLQSGFAEKCSFCPCYELENEQSAVVWEELNTVTGRYYKNIDRLINWPDNRKVHLQHSVDITDLKLAEASLEKRLQQQELMSEISQRFTSTRDIGELIDEALKKSGEFIGANQAFLSVYDEDGGYFECRYEWYDKHGKSFIGGESRWPVNKNMQIYDDLIVNGYAAVNDFSYTAHPNFYPMRDYGLRSFLNIPIEVSGNFWGILGFVLYTRQYEWNDSDVHLGKLLAGVFSNVVSRGIAEEKLRKAKDIAERASTAKSEFLARMSHEMRTPMNAIIGMTGIAQNSSDPVKKEYCLGKIDGASKHLLSIINDILDMSKIEANKLELSPIEFDLEKMLIDVTGVINFRVEERSQTFIINIGENVPTVCFADEMRFSQVVMNLLTNAVKFTPDGGLIELNVMVAETEGDTVTLLVEVVDNGIGISQEQQARLFTSFEQADGGIARKYGGTGLGLAISRGIVDMMGGRIWIESELGKGSKFSFTVAVQAGPQMPKRGIADEILALGVRVLAVTDSPELAAFLRRVMPETGLFNAVTDSNGALAEAENATEPFDIALVDRAIGGDESIALVRELRSVLSDGASVIMLSPADWSGFEDEATGAGVNAFLAKPLFASTIANAINTVRGAQQPAVPDSAQGENYDFTKYTILMAEDVEINREIIYAVLEDTGVTIEHAENGVEAVAMFGSAPDKYDLVLMDIHMPEMDGYEASRRIRALNAPAAHSVPIVAMTANVFREDVERCMESGMNGHIGKPVDTGELFTKLSHYLGG